MYIEQSLGKNKKIPIGVIPAKESNDEVFEACLRRLEQQIQAAEQSTHHVKVNGKVIVLISYFLRYFCISSCDQLFLFELLEVSYNPQQAALDLKSILGQEANPDPSFRFGSKFKLPLTTKENSN